MAVGPAVGGTLKPHRGVLVLIMGILAILFNVCFIPGILAIVYGNQDMKEMDAGQMDPEGRGLTQAGRIMGFIGTGLAILGVIGYVIVLALGGMAAMAPGGPR